MQARTTLRALRLGLHLTQQEVAAIAGIALGTYQNAERGRAPVSWRIARVIAQAVGAELEQIEGLRISSRPYRRMKKSEAYLYEAPASAAQSTPGDPPPGC